MNDLIKEKAKTKSLRTRRMGFKLRISRILKKRWINWGWGGCL